MWKPSRINQSPPKHDSIIIAVPEKAIKDIPGGSAALSRTLENLHLTQENVWPYTVNNVPEYVLFAYVAFNGKIRYRMNIIGHEKDTTKKIDYGGSFRMFENRNWILLSGPAIKAPTVIPYVGYYGFKFTERLF
jgi:hypothetical protein